MKDKLKQEKISIEYCPTELMLADFFTKPLQGNLFRKFRAVIMGWAPISSIRYKGAKEHVEGSMKMLTSVSAEKQQIPRTEKRSWVDVVKSGDKNRQAGVAAMDVARIAKSNSRK